MEEALVLSGAIGIGGLLLGLGACGGTATTRAPDHAGDAGVLEDAKLVSDSGVEESGATPGASCGLATDLAYGTETGGDLDTPGEDPARVER